MGGQKQRLEHTVNAEAYQIDALRRKLSRRRALNLQK